MNKEDFIKQRMEIDHITRETFDKTYLVIPCNCGAIYCHGYKCLEKNKIDEWLVLYINNLKKENQQSKKQKDDVVEYINSHKEKLHHYFDEPDCDYWLTCNPDDLLRMLGEIDE